MSDHHDSQSRWSSARERKDKERAREVQREASKRERLARESGPTPDPAPKRSSPRRLTDDERRTIREFRFPSASSSGESIAASPPDPEPEPSSSEETSSTARPRRVGTSRRWRESLEAANAAREEGPSLPPLPGDSENVPRGRSGNGGRVVIFGAILFVVMAIVAFLPFGPLGDNANPDPTSTQVPTVSSQIAETPGTDGATRPPTTVASSDNKQVVCIDPGHGGWDTGRTRPSTGDNPYGPPEVNEAELNLGMGLTLRDMLEEEGVTVVMTRVGGGAVNTLDEDVNGDGQTRRNVDDAERALQAGDRDELQARINICNKAGADILISVHLNGFDDRTVRGFETLYTAERDFGGQNQELATLIYRRMFAAMAGSDYGEGNARGAKPDSEVDAELHDLGSEEHYLMIGPAIDKTDYQIVPSAMPGVIVEGIFLTNDQDAAFIMQPTNQELLCRAYTQGILDYFERYPG